MYSCRHSRRRSWHISIWVLATCLALATWAPGCGIFDDDAVLRLDPNLNSDPQPDMFASAAVFWNTGRVAATFERFTRFIDKAQVVKCSS